MKNSPPYQRLAPSRFGWLCMLFVASVSCDKHEDEHAPGHDHSREHPAGHDHHAEGHGHEEPVVRITRWSSTFELFAEHEPWVAGTRASLLVHLTVLDRFRPLAQGAVRLVLDGPATLEATSKRPLQDGIFRLDFTPPKPGVYRARLVIEGPPADVIRDLSFEVAPSSDQLPDLVSEPHTGLIELLKEQQWGVPFATTFSERGTLVESIEVAGTVDTPPGGSAIVGAPVAGRLLPPAKGLPHPGTSVKQGQLLATLAPSPSSPEGAARAELAVAEAEARFEAARAALERAERLMADEAIAQRDLEDARREVGVADAALSAAKRAAALFSGARSGGAAGAWRLSAPIAGTLTEVNARPGASVTPADVLFRIVDEKNLWIRARVPEQDAARLKMDRDASYQVAGLERWTPIDVSGEDATASVVSVGKTVDAKSRTVDLIYSLRQPSPDLRIGGLVRVSLPTGTEFEGVTVPVTAIVHDEGRELVYVQVDGEHFQERVVKTAARAGNRVGIERGLKSGERIVTTGAQLVRLTDRASSSGQPHGHVH